MSKGSVRGAEEAIKRHGGIHNLPLMDGPIVEKFNARHIAQAIEQEIERCVLVGWPRISLHMNLEHAKRLAMFLRKGG